MDPDDAVAKEVMDLLEEELLGPKKKATEKKKKAVEVFKNKKVVTPKGSQS